MKSPIAIFTGFLFIFTLTSLHAQQPVKLFKRSDFTADDSTRLLNEYGKNKVLPPGFELQALIALSFFPELKNTHINFIIKPAYSLLQTRPLSHGILCRRSRRFSITISDSSYWKLQPIELDSMNFNAQVGVLGHELSHVSDFSRRSFLSLARSGIGHISSKYIDRFEYMTDGICIAHGLGYQLLGWSTFVRATLHTDNYDGADNIDKPMLHERYMNPATILAKIAANPLYK